MRRGVARLHRKTWLAACLLALAVGGWLRLAGLDHGAVGPDQSILVSLAMAWVRGGPLPLAANKASAGIMNPPLVEYLIGLPLFLAPSLRAPVIAQALLSLAGLAIMAAFAWRVFSPGVAALATLLFAVSPWAVFYSHFLWNPNPLLFFAPAALVALILFVRGREPRSAWWLTVALLALAAISQLHLSGLALVPTFALCLLLLWNRWPVTGWRRLAPLLAGLGLAILLYLPYILYQRAVGFGDLQALANALVGGRSGVTGAVGQAATNTASLRLIAELSSGHGLVGSPGASSWEFLRWPLAATLAVLVAWGLWRGWRGRRGPDAPLLILALWIVVPGLLFLRHAVYLQNYYFLYVLPAPFLLAGIAVDRALTSDRTAWRATGLAALALLAGLSAWQLTMTWPGSTPPSAGGAPRLAELEAAIEASAALASAYPICDFVLLGEGASVESSTLGLVEAFLPPGRARLAGGGRGLIVPAGCGLFLLAEDDAIAADWLQKHAEPIGPTIAVSPGSAWRFFILPTGSSPAEPPLARWSNGLVLLSSALEGDLLPGGALKLQLEWRVDRRPPADVRYHFFNHVRDQGGRVVAQDDAPAILTLYWRQGDTLITEFTIAVPDDLTPGRYQLATGLYTWPDLVRVPLVGDAGDSYPLGELDWP